MWGLAVDGERSSVWGFAWRTPLVIFPLLLFMEENRVLGLLVSSLLYICLLSLFNERKKPKILPVDVGTLLNHEKSVCCVLVLFLLLIACWF